MFFISFDLYYLHKYTYGKMTYGLDSSKKDVTRINITTFKKTCFGILMQSLVY